MGHLLDVFFRWWFQPEAVKYFQVLHCGCSVNVSLWNKKTAIFFFFSDFGHKKARALKVSAFSSQLYTMTLSNPDSDFHIRSARSQIPKSYLSEIEPGFLTFHYVKSSRYKSDISSGAFSCGVFFYGGGRHSLTLEFSVCVCRLKVWAIVMMPPLLSNTGCLRVWIRLSSFSQLSAWSGAPRAAWNSSNGFFTSCGVTTPANIKLQRLVDSLSRGPVW